MAASNIVNVPLVLKELWLDRIEDFKYEDRPFYAMVDKDTSWSGLKLHVTMQYANGTSTSSKFGTAKDNKRASKFAAMEVETADLFTLWSVDNKLITLTRDQKGSLVRMLDKATTDAQDKHRRRTAWQLWGNGGGAAAKLSAASGTTLTLSNANQVRNFDIGDPIEFSSDDGRGGAGVLSETRDITAIDPDAGTITIDATIAGTALAGVTANYYVFHEGDYGDDDHVIKGVTSYICLETPGTGSEPTSIWGMSRSARPEVLGGSRLTPSANLIVVEAVKEALVKAYRRSIDVTHLFCSPEIFNEVEMSLEGQRRYADEKVGKVGFTGLEFSSISGKSVKLFADPDIPLGPSGEELVFGLNMPKWTFHTAEEWPMWLTADGAKKFLTEENANAREGRLGGYGNLYPTTANQFVLLLG
jgi:hypothetical protein